MSTRVGYERCLQGFRRHFALFGLLLAAVALQADDHAELRNQEEREWLRSLSEPIIVGTEVNYRPYAYLNDEGEFDGVTADYLRLIEDKLGISFVVHEFESFADMLDAAEKRYAIASSPVLTRREISNTPTWRFSKLTVSRACKGDACIQWRSGMPGAWSSGR